ncbi:glycosyl transferase, group 1 [Syntrophobacter fumaroxidans MPOB]|uniref:Glycosyl transferase, group 1 n=2 Tax=Syntrophobacter TaxID=29526 RepID=A0LKB8_SYNFM|nr:glycosyl transferase, group 1 [Syntrophobacter fumaroxidans MPOB]
MNPRPRICHVITTPTDQYSSGLRTRMEAKIARDLGYDVDVVTGVGPRDGRLISEGVEGVTYWRIPALSKYIYPHRDAKAFFDICSLFRRNRYQIVQTHLAKAGVLGRLAAGLAGVPIIVHDVHGPSFSSSQSLPGRELFINLERLAGLVTTHYLFYTNHLKDTFATKGIGNNAKHRVIYPDLRLKQFLDAPPLPVEERSRLRRIWHLAPDHLVVGYVARMVPSKGHHLAIEAFARLAERWPHARLVLVGGAIWPEEQAYCQRLQAQVDALHLVEKVIFTGHQLQVIPFYQMFDLFAMPSLYEGTANAMLEAMVMGLPVVAFDIPAVHEFCPSETIVCPFADAKGLAQGLDRCLTLLSTTPTAVCPSPAFRQALVAKFSSRRWHQELSDFYMRLVDDQGAGIRDPNSSKRGD